MRLSDLQNKDVVCVNDGKKIGNIIDINIDDNGRLESLIVEKGKFIISRFTTSNEIEIKWVQIEKIGADVILVNLNQTSEN
jgi:YlmC/YmxH family sporulation protein